MSLSQLNNAHFKICDWHEEKYQTLPPSGKLSKATVKKQYTGDLIGEGTLEYLMSYIDDGNASFIGYEYVEATFKGKTGCFVLKHHGEFSQGQVVSQFEVVEGSASGELTGLSGHGSYEAGHSFEIDYLFSYEL